MKVARAGHTATLLRDGRVLVTGGDQRDHVLRSAEIYDPRTRRFSKAGVMSWPHFKCSDAVVLEPSGAVVVAGGWNVVEIYRARRFEPATRLDAARYFSTATVLRTGVVLLAGGYDRALRPTAAAFLHRP